MMLSPLAIILMPFVLLVIVLGFVTLNRYINYKERVALAQLGFSLEDLNRAASEKRHGNRGVLWGGVITATSGLALLLGLATLGVGAWLLGGLLPLCVGLGMVLIYFAPSGLIPSSDKGLKVEPEELRGGGIGQEGDDATPETPFTDPTDTTGGSGVGTE